MLPPPADLMSSSVDHNPPFCTPATFYAGCDFVRPMMDVHTQLREATSFSILNDNDSPSFAIRPRQLRQSLSPASVAASVARSTSASGSGFISASTSPSPRPDRQVRPYLPRQDHYTRASSFSSGGAPPLSRLSSNSSMDSSPSPITPAYTYNDSTLPPFDQLTRQDLATYLPQPSPTTITPFLEQQLLIAPNMMPDHFVGKQFQSTLPLAQYPIHAPIPPVFPINNPTSANSSVLPASTAPATSSVTTPVKIQSKTSPQTTSGPTPGKKNKYPCPYAQSQSCTATFTTSGHAARHGKKHTGEKGVHCPVCNKAFTRKDNMKQHERTHKGSMSGSNSDNSSVRRSKASITKVAQKARQAQKDDTTLPDRSRRSSLMRSPLSEVTSLAPPATDTSLSTESSLATNFYPDTQQMLMPIQTIPETLSPNTFYSNELLMQQQSSILPLPQLMLDKADDFTLAGNMPSAPPLLRGFSDLDTLANVAGAAYDPNYYSGQNL
ncbi:hypothetical protein LTR84_006289 [Exophiala bonariae]|uniref:C2H2 type master regulator of conidiophore development brlA n=1 Tax=Exophiala bonariae TaxID=1690606 RepID=A0AAV9N0T3_9EURO|nr:hypothetical protein LTR84_006289 [Exophiala bonariae]